MPRNRRSDAQRKAIFARLQAKGYFPHKRGFGFGELRFGASKRPFGASSLFTPTDKTSDIVSGSWTKAGSLVNRIPIKTYGASPDTVKTIRDTLSRLPKKDVQAVINSGSLNSIKVFGKDSTLKERWKNQERSVTLAPLVGAITGSIGTSIQADRVGARGKHLAIAAGIGAVTGSLGGFALQKALYGTHNDRTGGLELHDKNIKSGQPSALRTFLHNKLGPKYINKHSKYDPLSAIVSHEFGHAVDSTESHKNYLEAVKTKEFFKRLSLKMNAIKSRESLKDNTYTKSTNDFKRRAPTSYSTTNPVENYAEAYALYASPIGREYLKVAHPKLYDYMDKKFRKKGK